MNTKNQSLEGLRGAAALLVVFFHMGTLDQYSGVVKVGYLAVDLFFVLSGFVICSAYSDQLETGRDIWRFIARRIGRLWPLHITAVILFYAAIGIPNLLAEQFTFLPTSTEALSILTMTQGIIPFGHEVGNPVAWSTSDEFYVYLLFAIICLCARSRKRLIFAAMAGTAFAVVLYVDVPACAHTGACLDLHSSFGFFRCAAGFFIGAFVALSPRHLFALNTPRAQMTAAIATLLFIATTDRMPLSAFAAPFVFAVLIASLSSDRGPAAAFLQTRPMQYLGRTSYALYLGHAVFYLLHASWLIHYGVNDVGNQLIAGVAFLFASFALAHLLHRYIEVPFRDRIYSWIDSRIDHHTPALLRHGPEDSSGHAGEECLHID